MVLARANSLSLVRFDRNDYSVPVSWAHHRLTVVGDIETVRVMHGDQIIVEHPRGWGLIFDRDIGNTLFRANSDPMECPRKL